jgi:hypothetical protein
MTNNDLNRLAGIIADARKLLARPPSESPANLAVLCGQLEAMLKMLADSAEAVAYMRLREQPRAAGGSGG